MRPSGADKRGVYFAFQGLLMSVLLLLFVFHYEDVRGWAPRFLALLIPLTASLAFIQFAPGRVLNRWWVQTAFFVLDAGLASLTLHWTERNPDFFLLYFLIIFGTALTRSMLQSLVVASVLSVLYFALYWSPAVGFAVETDFWLRLNFLWITTFLLTILSRDSQQAQAEQTRNYQNRLAQMESLATLGEIAGEVAHRIKGPLTTILVNAEIVAHKFDGNQAARKELTQIQDEVGHCKTILKDLLNIGRIEEADFRRIDLRGPIRSAVKAIEPRMRSVGVSLKKNPMRSALFARGDRSLLHEAIFAVLNNAVDASERGGTVELIVEEAGREPWWRGRPGPASHSIQVVDQGSGIDPKDMDRLFKPFFTTKGPEGSGLGLSAAMRILQKHDGALEAQSDGPGAGATFTIRIPQS